MIVRIADANPLLPDDLDFEVVDASAPRSTSDVTRTSPKVAQQVEAYRRARRDSIDEMLTALGLSHVLTQGDSTVVDDVVSLLRGREFRRARA